MGGGVYVWVLVVGQVGVLGWGGGWWGSLGNASSGQSGTVGARVAGPFVWVIQCDTRETKAD